MEQTQPPFFSKGFVGILAGGLLLASVVVFLEAYRDPGAEIRSFYEPRVEALAGLEAAHTAYSDKLDTYILRQTVDPDAMDAAAARLSELANELMTPFPSPSVPADDACRAFQDAMRDYGLASVAVATACRRVNAYIREHNPAGREQAAVVRRMLKDAMARLEVASTDLETKRQALIAAHPFLAPGAIAAP